MVYDARTKPETQWTYYVVDELPRMANLYRFDTPEEAIAKYRELPETNHSAIGASIGGKSEYDLIHRGDGDRAILIMDHLYSKNPVWRESKEFQNALDLIIAELRVEHQYDHTVFGRNYSSAAIELERYRDDHLDPYFKDKVLQLSEPSPDKDPNRLSGINEVFVFGKGWMNTEDFLRLLDNSRPQFIGDARKTVYVDSMNVQYKAADGRTGQADIHPREFKLLREKTERELAAGEKKLPLDSVIGRAEQKRAGGEKSKNTSPDLCR